jgi:hypothetical protein
MLASACSTRRQQSTAGQAAGWGFFRNALIKREIYFPIARHRGAAEGRNGRERGGADARRGGLANRDRAKCLDGHLIRPSGNCGSKNTDLFVAIACERERAAACKSLLISRLHGRRRCGGPMRRRGLQRPWPDHDSVTILFSVGWRRDGSGCSRFQRSKGLMIFYQRWKHLRC